MKKFEFAGLWAAGKSFGVGVLVLAAFGRPLNVHSETTAALSASNVASGQGGPVLVELFTSEGCSSCPPADAVLARLDAAHAVGDASVIVLSEHVTYWDHLGWRDPYSLDQVTRRQQKYASEFGLDSVYTPQTVVDGRAQVVGSDEAKLIHAVTEAAAEPKRDVELRDVHAAGGAIGFTLRANVNAGEFVTVVVAKDAAQSSVLHGENGGRTLRHVAVVRFMTELSAARLDGKPLSVMVPPGDASGTDPLRLVAFVTERKSGHVVGAAEALVRR